MSAPLCVDLFCGLGGWTEGFLAEGYRVVGFDIEQHVYGEHRYPAQLVIQDVLTLHGKQFRDAAVIVASPPCQEFSYMAMPWTRAKAKAAKLREDAEDRKRLTAFFDACFRIQREASAAAGHHIPLVVENVRGAQEWVGAARWHFGSFYLWGDVPALMPTTTPRAKVPGQDWNRFNKTGEVSQFNWASERAVREELGKCVYAHTPRTQRCGKPAVCTVEGLSGRALSVCAKHATLVDRIRASVGHVEPAGEGNTDGSKVGGDWFGSYAEQKAAGTISPGRLHGKGSVQRKAASAKIAMIPLALSRHIAHVYREPLRGAA